MKTLIPTIILVHLYLLFLVCMFLSSSNLPERVTTSFNFSGQPDEWTSRSSYVISFVGFSSAGLLLMIILGFACRFLPKSWISIPQRDYWLAPQRRPETAKYMARQMLWFDCLLVVFLAGFHFSIVQANRLNPVRLPKTTFLGLLTFFIIAVIIWVLIVNRHFKRLPKNTD